MGMNLITINKKVSSKIEKCDIVYEVFYYYNFYYIENFIFYPEEGELF